MEDPSSDQACPARRQRPLFERDLGERVLRGQSVGRAFTRTRVQVVQRCCASEVIGCLFDEPALAALEREELLLDRNPTTVAGELAVRANDAMTGNDTGE